ncbi:MAG: NAD(+) synthase [Oscillospiraceae bacterium]|nr:NAD(+) synthase [Oscillospiraceae bacterium]
MKDGFVKVAAASPVIKVADCEYNAARVIETMEKADALGVKVLAFPELTLTGVTCGDFIRHRVVLDGALRALETVVRASEGRDMLIFVGLPFAFGAKLLSVAAVVYSGELLGLVPRESVRNSAFAEYEGEGDFVQVGAYETVICTNTLFTHAALGELAVAVELGADLDEPLAPAFAYALEGATLIVRMAAFPQTVSSDDERKAELCALTARLCCASLLAAPGRGESTTDNSYSGLCLAAENGELLAAEEGADSFAVTEIDVQLLMNLRRRRGGYDVPGRDLCLESWGGELSETALTRRFSKHPHLPEGEEALSKYCERMLDIQVSGLVRRMEYAHLDHCVVGISGGVDSTLAVLVSAMAVKRMGLPSTNVIACTMPCFGTSSRTKSNAVVVAEQIGAEVRVIDITKSVLQHFDDIGHAHDDYSVAFENAQARERTQILMDLANKCGGLDVGTEDLSEYIDGWCTYNGDHTSMYDVNLGLTKTQVRAAVAHIAAGTDDKLLKTALYDVLDCPVTPELLPIHDDLIEQKSEDAVGSYSLQDFFTHKLLICGFDPIKAMRLAKAAYGDEFSDEELLRWLRSYCTRLFAQQFKRSCLMDGPAVEDFSVSPRTGLHMPSDGESALFLKMLDEYEANTL